MVSVQRLEPCCPRMQLLVEWRKAHHFLDGIWWVSSDVKEKAEWRNTAACPYCGAKLATVEVPEMNDLRAASE